LSLQALAGLALLNLLFLGSGTALVWALRGFDSWVEVAKLAGLAYLTGVASVGSIWTLLLMAGIPFSLAVLLAIPGAVFAAAVYAGRRRGMRRPALGSVAAGPGLFVAAVAIATVGLFLQAAFRSARLEGLYSWDAWSFWVPKAKAIYFYGGLDEQFFTTLPGPSYPPLVPVLDAAAFHVMGSPDVVTLHVQNWFFGVGFVWALAGLLAERVPAWILWPYVLLALVAPRIGSRLHIPEADLLLDFFFVVSADLVFVWLLDRQSWRLVVASILLCGMILTKREGLLLGAVLVVATLVAGRQGLRKTWRPIAAMVAAVVAVAIPWRVWYIAHGVGGEGPAGGGIVPSDGGERLRDSIRLAVEVLVDTGYWSLIAPLAVGALVLAALARVGVPVVFFGTLIVLVTLGGGWITWAIPELEITEELGANPIVRFMGAATLTCIAATPILLASAWSAATGDEQDGVSQ
jgi:hypothetical protein